MQSRSTLYTELLNARGTKVETKAIIAGVEYSGKSLCSDAYGAALLPSSNVELFSDGRPSVGNCVAGELSITVVNGASVVPRMADIEMFIRLVRGEEASEWLPKGVFYVDTRSKRNGITSFHCFDAMLKMEELYLTDGETSATWPLPATDVMTHIAARIGVELDPRNLLNENCMIPYPADFTVREVAGFIAAMHAGNWVISPAGRLRLVPLVPAFAPYDLGVAVSKSDTADEFEPYTGVQFWYSDTNTFAAGDVTGSTGRVLEIECPWATQEIADTVLAMIDGYIYQPFSAEKAYLDPAAELGDAISVNGVASVLAAINTKFNSACTADISAPAEEEIDHEYPYESKLVRETRREFAKVNASITVGFDEINLRVTDNENDISNLQQTSDSIQLQVDGHGEDIASLQVTAGQIESSVQGLEGDVSQLQQTAGMVRIAVSDQDGTLETVIDASTWQAIYKAVNGITESGFYFDFELGRFVYDGTGVFTSSDGSTYISIEGDELVLHSDKDTGEALDKMSLGFITGLSPDGTKSVDYPYIKLGSAGSYSVGLFKKFWNGLWMGNSAPLELVGNFEGCDGASGIFVNTTTGVTYVVSGTNMQNIYTGEAIAKFA